MKFLIIKYVNLFLISINIFTYNVDAVNCSDLKIICAPRWGTEITPTPPPKCTTISLSRFDKVLLGDLNSIKGTLPLMAIDDRYFYYEWAEIIKKPIKEYMQDFIDVGVNVIAINMKNELEISYYYPNNHPGRVTKAEVKNFTNPEFCKNITIFFDNLKKDYPEILFGFSLERNEDPIRNSINLKELNTHVDFYLLRFIVYRVCEFPDKLPPVFSASRDDIKGSVKLFNDVGMDTDKLIYTIDLTIKTIKHDEREDMAYSQVCSKKVSKHRHLCYQTIPDIFDKAHLLQDEKLLGIYVDDTDYDDFNASCNCLDKDGNPIAFKGLSVITGACCDPNAKVESFVCDTFPKITRP